VVYPKLEDLSAVNGTPLETTGQIPVWNNTTKYFDFDFNINNYALKTDYLKLDQTTPQPTIGRFTFPNIAVDTDLIYTDSVNKRIGIGTTAPANILTINKDTDAFIQIGNANTFFWKFGRNASNGRFSINNTDT